MRDGYIFNIESKLNNLAAVAESNTKIIATEIEVLKCKHTAMERFFFVGGFALVWRMVKSIFMPSFALYEFQTLFQMELMKLAKQKEEVKKKQKEAEEKAKTEIKIIKPGQVPGLVGGKNGE